MFRHCIFLLALAAGSSIVRADEPVAPNPANVVALYNSSIPESKKLAETYAAARNIPAKNLIGLPLSQDEEISRSEYNNTLRDPLVAELDKRELWKRAKTVNGGMGLQSLVIRYLVCLRGVPSRIRHEGPPPKPGEEQSAILQENEAAVDSELTVAGQDGLPLDGPLPNPYYNKDQPFTATTLPMILVGRIDGPSWETCERMIRDAIAVEKTGLWGMAVIDLSQKYPEGDDWLNKITADHLKEGIPTLVDRFPNSLPLYFPLKDTAIYYGWYDWHVSGPFLNPGFRFKPGAVAVHLHSFSAAQLRNPLQNWCAPLLDRGAAATLGNVYEPLLDWTHHFDIFQERLLEGYTLIEAAYMSVPKVSWQNIVLGDPLYRPFIHFDGSGEKADADRDYRVLRMAAQRWGAEPEKQESNLNEAVTNLKSGVLAEAMGLADMNRGQDPAAVTNFEKARKLYSDKKDLLRLDMEEIAILRNAGKTAEAIKRLKEIKPHYEGLLESAAITSWLTVLDPPAPPPAKPK